MENRTANTIENTHPETENVSVTELKAHLGSYMKQVREGIRQLVVERYDCPIAVIEPAQSVELNHLQSKNISVTEFKAKLGAWLKSGMHLVLTNRNKVFATVTVYQQNMFPKEPTLN